MVIELMSFREDVLEFCYCYPSKLSLSSESIADLYCLRGLLWLGLPTLLTVSLNSSLFFSISSSESDELVY